MLGLFVPLVGMAALGLERLSAVHVAGVILLLVAAFLMC